MKIEGAIALVTGANRGIGKAISTALLDRGAAKVYAAVRDVTTVATDDPRLVPVQLDVTDPAQVRSVAAALGDVEIVVNNAGIGRPATPLTATVEDARAELRQKLAAGMTKEQIIEDYAQAHGTEALSIPPDHGALRAIYTVPLALIGVGGVGLLVVVNRWRKRDDHGAPGSAAPGASVSVSSSTSAKTGRAPARRMARPPKAAVSGLVTTSSPPTPGNRQVSTSFFAPFWPGRDDSGPPSEQEDGPRTTYDVGQ